MAEILPERASTRRDLHPVIAATMLVALVVAAWWPIAGLVVLASSSIPERLLARRAPAAYRRWA